jgi:hypothetical protein
LLYFDFCDLAVFVWSYQEVASAAPEKANEIVPIQRELARIKESIVRTYILSRI